MSTVSTRKGANKSVTTEVIVERVTAAINEHRLKPGMKLGEKELGDAFGVSRAMIRQALFQLAKDKLIVLLPNRGAYVAQPSVKEARQIFAVRRMLEKEVASTLAQQISEQQLQQLRAHLQRQAEAVAVNDFHARTKLFSEFHLMLAEMAGNDVLTEMLREIISRTSLIIGHYQTSLPIAYSCEEHGDLLKSLENHDAEAAMAQMVHHLEHLENSLNLREAGSDAVDLKEVFGFKAAKTA